MSGIYKKGLVSIIVPVYKVEPYLIQCIESLINQTYRNIEIILVDDGGIDNCPQICDMYSLKDSRVICVHKKNEGQSYARKDGLKIAHGEFIMYVDSDDWLDKETIETCIQSIDNVDVVMFGYKRIYTNKIFNTHLFDSNRDLDACYVHRRMVGLLGTELQQVEEADRLVTMWGKVYRHEVASQGMWISEREVCTSEDALYNLSVFKYCKNVRYINQCFYNYRKTDLGTCTRKYRKDMFSKWLILFEYIRNYIDANIIYEKSNYLDALSNRIALSPVALGLNEICNDKGFLDSVRNMRMILRNETVRNALMQLDTSFMPFKWKLFFELCKHGNAFSIVLMLNCIDILRKRISR